MPLSTSRNPCKQVLEVYIIVILIGYAKADLGKEIIEAARKEYKQLLDEGWKKTSIFSSYF